MNWLASVDLGGSKGFRRRVARLRSVLLIDATGDVLDFLNLTDYEGFDFGIEPVHQVLLNDAGNV